MMPFDSHTFSPTYIHHSHHTNLLGGFQTLGEEFGHIIVEGKGGSTTPSLQSKKKQLSNYGSLGPISKRVERGY